ncbi:MAG TPA: alcohol dehydrogenase catalytic domain-containing protein [Acidimicrobiia bacterium]
MSRRPSERTAGEMPIDRTPAARLVGVRRLEQVEAPVPDPGPGEVLIRVLAMGLCGSDAHWFREGGIGDATIPQGGVIPGHEFCGVIESGPRQGERVAIDPAIPCLECEECARGKLNLCLRMRFAGHGSTDGALRRHLVWPERCLVSLPDSVPDDEGALLEPLGIALHATDLGDVGVSDATGVIGCGPIGLLVISALFAQGVKTILAAELLDHRLAVARELGAERWSDDSGLDVVFDCAGTDESLHTALEALAPGGRVVMVGVPDGDRTSFVASLARRKEASLLTCRRMLPEDLERAAALAGAGEVDLGALITHRFPMSSAHSAFETLVARTGIKVVVLPGHS